MAGWSAMGIVPRVAIAAAAVVCAAAFGYWAFLDRPAPVREPIARVSLPETTAEPITALKEPVASSVVPPSLAEPEQVPKAAAPAPPTFDVVRIEQDGSALVAGRASPGSGISVLVDATEVANVIADASGGFVALFSLPSSDAARLLTLQMRLADGQAIASAEQVVLSPVDVLPTEKVAVAPALVDDEPQPPVKEAVASPAKPPPPATALPETGLVLGDAPQAGASDDRQALLESPEGGGAAPLIAPEASGPLSETATSMVRPQPNPLTSPEQSNAPTDEVAQAPVDADEPANPDISAGAVNVATEPEAETPDKSATETSRPASGPAAPAAILMGPQGVRVLQSSDSADKGELRPVSIDAISYSSSGAVQLAGRGMPGANVRLYLDNAPLTAFVIGPDGGWGGTLPETPPGLYTLRADQLDKNGKVTARFETPFQRETREALAAASGPKPNPQPKASPEAVPPQQPEQNPEPAKAVVAAAPTAETIRDPQPKIAEKTPTENQSLPSVQTKEEPPAKQPEIITSAETAPVTPIPLETAPIAKTTQIATATTTPKPAPVTVTVQPGFTLWAIARDQFGEGMMYVQVYEVNKDRIRDPDLIYPGQVFSLPQSTDR